MGSLSYLYLSIFREIKQAKEKQRIIRTGRNKFNANPKEVHVDKSLYFVCIAISILACTCETTAVLQNMHVTEIEHALLVSLGEKMSKHCRAFLLMKFCNESLCVSLILKQNVKLLFSFSRVSSSFNLRTFLVKVLMRLLGGCSRLNY